MHVATQNKDTFPTSLRVRILGQWNVAEGDTTDGAATPFCFHPSHRRDAF